MKLGRLIGILIVLEDVEFVGIEFLLLELISSDEYDYYIVVGKRGRGRCKKPEFMF